MAHSKKETAQERRVVVLRNVDAGLPTTWADAVAIEPESTTWAKTIETCMKSPGLCDWTISIADEVYAFLRGEASDGDIAAEIADAMRMTAADIIEDDYIRGEVDEFLSDGDVSCLGPYTVVVEWTMVQAFHIAGDIRSSVCEVGCIELAKVGATSPDTIKVAVSLPVAIFNAVMAKHLEPGPHRPMADCVFDAIVDAKKLEPTPPSMFAEYEIPF